MLLDVLFDGESINRKFGISLKARPLIPIAEMEYEEVDVPGRNGSLTRKLGYKSKPFKLEFNFIELNGAKIKFREIVSWLNNKNRISFSDDIEMYRVIQTVNFEDAENDLGDFVGFVLELGTEPFWYQDAGVSHIESSGKIINPSAEEAPCIIRGKAKGNGNCEIIINQKRMVFKGTKGELVIDGILGHAIDDEGPADNKMEGKYPVLFPGENEVTVSGNISDVSVEKRWCWR